LKELVLFGVDDERVDSITVNHIQNSIWNLIIEVEVQAFVEAVKVNVTCFTEATQLVGISVFYD